MAIPHFAPGAYAAQGTLKTSQKTSPRQLAPSLVTETRTAQFKSSSSKGFHLRVIARSWGGRGVQKQNEG
eukprot:3805625-Alexandrium_andersonii.AAC.1